MMTPLTATPPSDRPQPVFERIPLGDLTPFMIYLRLCPSPPAFLLESVKGPERLARYSFIAFDPFLTLQCRGHSTLLTRDGIQAEPGGDPLTLLARLMGRYAITRPPGLPPFFGGAVGYMGYNLLHLLEEIPRKSADDLQLPDLFFAFCETIIAIDHLEKLAYIIRSPDPDAFRTRDAKQIYRQARRKIGEIKQRLSRPARHEQDLAGGSPSPMIPMESNLSPDAYVARVRRCQEYIAQGDIFQANLSIRFSAPFRSSAPLAAYAILRDVNPSPFAVFADLDDMQIVGSSPERLVRVEDRKIETRPIAGTRPRGVTRAEDDRFKNHLLASPKERAEHLMLVDLERNDLGRVCRFGSIKVDELMVTEAYSHVMHIVSNIQGELREGVDCADVIRAVFPGGTITGVPKVRCMQIIDELEPVSRGIYTGSVGYISFAGDMDFNIIIRSILIKARRAYIQVGAGIVADSHPRREYEECLQKAEAMLKTLRMAYGLQMAR